MPVKWLGHRSIIVADQPVPEENWLVRIRKGAIADDVPSRDLLVTQEHCMIFDNRLVPARMLVNGVSIIIDRTINSYTYYHVELDSHEAVWAEHALMESYLDTGNRSQFTNSPVTARFGGRQPSGGSEGLLLETARWFVEPIHAALLARTQTQTSQRELTTNSDIHLVSNSDHIIQPLRQANDRVVFLIPADVRGFRICSRTARPSETVGPFVDDRRDLGVLVGVISLYAACETHSLTQHLTADSQPGWHDIESPLYRWTQGNAAVSLPEEGSPRHDPAILSIQIVAGGPYLITQTGEPEKLRKVA